MKAGLIEGADGVVRCGWCGEHADYLAYHDEEWGRPVGDDRRLFEKLSLEGFQAGLSWLTILRKRERFREVFEGFDMERVAAFDERKVRALLDDAGIIRHRGKIEAVISNARRSLAAYFWGFEPTEAERPERRDHAALASLSQTPASARLSRDLKKRGWKFVGPTTIYAFMQAMGLVNDHLEGCGLRAACAEDRKHFRRPCAD
jgi:DNA-3-methyladenine glycosylase I